MAGFQGFGYKAPEEIIAETQAGFQRALQSGNKDAMRAAIAQQAAFAIGGSPELRKARKTEKILSEAAKNAPQEGNDIEQQMGFYQNVLNKAEDAGIGDIALQAREKLVALKNLQLERDKLTAGVDQTRAITTQVSNKIDRDLTDAQLSEEQTALQAQLERLPEDSRAREAISTRLDFLQNRRRELGLERERSKNWTVTDVQTVNSQGVPVLQTYRVNNKDPDERVLMGEIPISELSKARASGSSGRQLATIEKFANENAERLAAVRQNMESARRVGAAAQGVDARGFKGKMRSSFRRFFGTEDAAEVNNKIIDEVLKTKAMALLPPGPASDRDVEIVMNTQFDSYSNADAIQESMKAYYRLKAREKLYYDFYDQYLASQPDNPSVVGVSTAFDEWYKENQRALEEKIQQETAQAFGEAPPPPQPDTGVTVISVQGP